jgi:hypothetical protein
MTQTSLKSIAENVTLTALSRLVQLVGIPLGIAAVVWAASTINQLELGVQQLKTQMEERTSDRYTATDARHDFAVVTVKIDDLDRRVGVLESIQAVGRRER